MTRPRRATSLGDTVALIAHADVVTSNDSDLMHIACGLNRPASSGNARWAIITA